MNKKLLRIPVIAGTVLALLAGVVYVAQALRNPASAPLQASGTIQAVNVDISPEVSGTVQTVHVVEGQAVKTGVVLMVLDSSLLQQQRKVAAAGLASTQASAGSAANALSIAQAQYQQTLSTALAQDQQARVEDWFPKDPNQFDQPAWYFTRAEQTQALQSQVDEAKAALDQSRASLDQLTQSVDAAGFLAAERRLEEARVAYVILKDVNQRAQNSVTKDAPAGAFNSSHCGTNRGYELSDPHLVNLIYGCTGDQHLMQTSQRLWSDAQAELAAAQQAYDALLGSDVAEKILEARAEVSVQQERYYSALDHLRALQTGDQSPAVIAAQSAVSQAQDGLDQAQKAVAEAQANLNLLDAQLARLTVYAPTDGVVLTRSIEPGEFIQAGQTAIAIGQLSHLTITVYVPEDRYGEVRLGQLATVTVDSFPGSHFNANVTYIADQAEFTPRNVQTAEGRSSTVYAIKLAVVDPQGLLKPGMPADVVFGH